MDQRTSYEITIAKKAGECPLPDLADAIWASVNAQLDQPGTDTGDKNPTSPQQQPPKGFTGFGTRLLFFAAAAIVISITALLLFNKGKKIPSSQPTPVSPNYIPQLPPQKKDNGHTDSITIQQVQHPHASSVKNSKPDIDSTSLKSDSVKLKPVIPASVIDSSARHAQIHIDSAGIVPVNKKPHGVKGISNNDYKIVSTKKDSVKQKN